MAQTKAFEWYKYEQPVAIPGMKADATTDVIDSYCASTGMNPGNVVKLGSADGVGAPILTADDLTDAVVVGVAVHTQKDYDGEGAYYQQGDAVPVMSFGDVYVEAGAVVAAGDAAGLEITEDGPRFVVASQTLTTGVALTGMTYLASGVKGDIVPLRIRK